MNAQVIAIIIAALVFSLGFALKGIYDEHVKRKVFLLKLKNDYGKFPNKEYDPIQYANIAKFYLKNRKENYIDDITWNDTDMDSVFMQMNHAFSSAGEEYLYYRLRTPKMTDEGVEQDEALIQYFIEHEEERIKLQKEFYTIGKTGKYSLFDYLDFLDTLGKRNNTKHIIANLLYAVGAGLIFVNAFTGVFFLIVLICYNILTYSSEKRDINPYITSLMYVLRIVDGVEAIDKLHIEEIHDKMEEMRKTAAYFKKFSRNSKWLRRGDSDTDPAAVVYIYLKMMFHIDLIVFNNMLKDVRMHIPDINKMVEHIGYLESVICIGAYRMSMGTYCLPEFVEDNRIAAVELYHPLIESPVKNSFEIKRGMLLTGSNASGKSTFLKTVALNAILAQTIHTCLADKYVAAHYRIFSSMALKDSIFDGESYYIVEIKSLKRILDASKDTTYPILCFVDEVLRGTNTVERIAASNQILKSMTEKNMKCFAATHDIELTQMLEEYYDNYHFDEEVLDNDIVFNYLLKSGRTTSRNAIKLLKIMGYQEEIIEKANLQAKEFTETGRW